MKSNKRKLLSILTAFVMAFTVFGCTGLSFAEESTDSGSTEVNVPASNDGQDNIVLLAEGEDSLEAPADDGSSADATSITLKWTAVEPISVGDQLSYEIYEDPDAASIATVDDPTTTWKKTGLEKGKTYTFYVKAVEVLDDGSGTVESPLSDPITLTCESKSIDAPTAKASTSAYRAVTFNWTAVSAVNGGTISYEIFETNDETAEPIKTLTALSWKVTELSPRAMAYTYYVKAVEKDADGNVIGESDFTALKGTPKDFSTLSGKLSGLVSDPGYKAVLLQWNKLDGATGYKIYWRKGGERGNIDTVGRDSDGHWMKTFRSSKTKPYVIAKKPGEYKYLDTVKQPKGDKVTFDKRGLDIMNHTYVYFYQFMIIPYYKDSEGEIYTKIGENKYQADALNKTTKDVAGKSNYNYNIVRNNTVLPMYVYETAKVNKPIYKTSSMNDGKKRGRLHKGHKFICWDKANGRVKFYGKKDGSGQPGETYWFAQKNAHTIQGYYMDNCRYGGKTNLKRKDWKTGYSKKTVLDYVNHCGIKSKTNYFVWASKYAQHVYILKKDKKTGKWALLDNGTNRIPTNTKGCWSNLCASGKVNIQSRNGHYVIFGKQYKANRSAYDYFCLSKLHKTVRLHSLLYKNGKKFSSFAYKNKVLGNPISKGCIRLRPYAAQWIYKNVPKKTRTLVY